MSQSRHKRLSRFTIYSNNSADSLDLLAKRHSGPAQGYLQDEDLREPFIHRLIRWTRALNCWRPIDRDGTAEALAEAHLCLLQRARRRARRLERRNTRRDACQSKETLLSL